MSLERRTKSLRELLHLGFLGTVLVAATVLLLHAPAAKAIDNRICCGDPNEFCGIVYNWTCDGNYGCEAVCCAQPNGFDCTYPIGQ
jgi:hypothetical protein